MPFKRFLVVTLCAASALAFSTIPNRAAAEVTVIEAAHKVNIAGRQRMLSQRIAKAACFAARGISEEHYRTQLSEAHDLFHTSLKALRHGNPQMRLSPEEIPEVIAAHGPVTYAWEEYRKPLSRILADRTVGRRTLLDLDPLSVEVLTLSDKVVRRTAYAYAAQNGHVSLSHTITVNIAGRQRMFSQRMVKQLCLLGVEGAPPELAESLAETADLFEKSLNALQNGMEEVAIMSAPTAEIAGKLAEVAADWEALKPVIEQALEGQLPDEAALESIDARAESLLGNMNEAVGLYEYIDAAL